MSYVSYDEQGNITGVFANRSDENQKFISDKSTEYKKYLSSVESACRKRDIISEIDILDKKRIRAIAEPSNHPDGGTWLEYYNEEIKKLREQISKLN